MATSQVIFTCYFTMNHCKNNRRFHMLRCDPMKAHSKAFSNATIDSFNFLLVCIFVMIEEKTKTSFSSKIKFNINHQLIINK